MTGYLLTLSGKLGLGLQPKSHSFASDSTRISTRV